jgi:rhodanese-related sulfurtransferase
MPTGGSVEVRILSNAVVRLLLFVTGSDFAIRHAPGSAPIVAGRIPMSKLGTIRDFFARDLGPTEPQVLVLGTLPRRSGNAPLRLRFLGLNDRLRRQRIRNFLTELFR